MAHVRDMGDTLVALAGLEEVSGGAGSAATVGAAKRAGERRSAEFRGYGLIGVAQTEAWGYGVLTEGL